ncbi:GNAT family N-acetyltransferase [Marinobacterium lacunae]|uniref:GNAT family N-acetyltransferase n=1 Tax=Marinobacterium lacunae TaxID=1232683 RepID=UPI00055C56FC|nr:GNAT family N-acetyltransferase [Marinobacterium lacunae]
MKPIVQQADNKGYVENLTRENMAVYYSKLGVLWDDALFSRNWNEFENYEITLNGSAVGVLRLSRDDVAYYIRDLQIEPRWQRHGLGSEAIFYAIEVARKAGVRLLRLRVFCINPAVALYDRIGFRVCKTEQGIHYMEREIS